MLPSIACSLRSCPSSRTLRFLWQCFHSSGPSAYLTLASARVCVLLAQSVLSLVDAELPKMRAAREAVLAQQQAQKAAAAAAAAAAEAAAEAAAAGASGSGGSAQQDGGSAAAAAGVVGGGGAAAGGDSAMDGNGEEVLRKKLATGGKPKWMKL